MLELPLREALGHFFVLNTGLLMLSRQIERLTVADSISPLEVSLLEEFAHPCLTHTLRLHDSSIF